MEIIEMKTVISEMKYSFDRLINKLDKGRQKKNL